MSAASRGAVVTALLSRRFQRETRGGETADEVIGVGTSEGGRDIYAMIVATESSAQGHPPPAHHGVE